ncbi:tyrosine-type recombinase/integrase [Aquibacillus salsiterrae]|uniref:Phage integrase N-terminal SAM-like domain-containing protein n=1 Tax=Aquibacillus salsiterrae TaxID=2950439 RepID=A0A9X3WH81_9BACI|nr:phage integrase N-terminal SAM-like domain-containing protein [Aquibacillus salsiterrae]MDC3418380.1 phage integrase N-terminal SAM-like domain-containing protein [Aquibacillus salsiterrae]
MKNSFPEHLTAFFTKHLTLHKGLSENTIASYSDTFILFFQYCRESCSIRQEQIDFSLFSKEFIMDFCNWIESERNCSVKTRNLRLTALPSFFRYVLSETPKYASMCSDILAIPMKKSPKKTPEHLTDIEIKMLLAEPDVHTREGIRDLAILALLYDTGTRISELDTPKQRRFKIIRKNNCPGNRKRK